MPSAQCEKIVYCSASILFKPSLAKTWAEIDDDGIQVKRFGDGQTMKVNNFIISQLRIAVPKFYLNLVWLKHWQSFSGLCMYRFGDHCLSQFGIEKY